jgi:hypothetical protein
MASGCGKTIPHITHDKIGQPTNIDDFLTMLEYRLGKENIFQYQNGNIILVHINGEDAYTFNTALNGVCKRSTRVDGGRDHLVKSRPRVSMTSSNDGDFKFSVGEYFSTGLSIIQEHYKPDYEFAPTSRSGPSYCLNYPSSTAVYIGDSRFQSRFADIPFGWNSYLGLFKAGEKSTTDHYALILKNGFFEPYLKDQKAQFNSKIDELIIAKKAKAKEERERAWKIQQENARLMKIKRDSARIDISRKENIGRRICKNGTLTYQHYKGYVVMGKPATQKMSEAGQIVAQLEDFSSDKYRIKFRVLNFGIPGGKLKGNTSEYPFMGDFKIEPGLVYWDEVTDWFMCGD